MTPRAQFRWRTFVPALAISTGILALLWHWIPPLYFTNDDVMFRLLIEGQAVPGQPPTGFLINAHPALGWALVFLQARVPGIPMWDAALAVVFVWPLAVLLSIAWNALGSTWVARAVALTASVVPVVPLLFGFQFTISSALAGGMAFALAFAEVSMPSRPRASVLSMSALLLIAGLLVRPLGAIAGALAVAVTFFSTVAAAGGFSNARLTRCVVVCVIGAATFAALSSLDTFMYRADPEWKADYEYHWKIVRLLDWGGAPAASDIPAIRSAAGWSPNDWELLIGWWGVDPALHGFDRVDRAYQASRARASSQGTLGSVAARLRVFDPRAFREELTESLPTVMAIAALVVAARVRRATVVLASVILCLVLFYFGLQIAFKELPFRLIAPLNVCLAGAVLVACRELQREARAAVALSVFAALAATVVFVVTTTVSAARAEEREAVDVQHQVADLLQLAPSLLVLHADSFPFEYWWRPFQTPAVQLPTLGLSFNNQGPLLQRFLSSTGRQPLLREICLDPSILVVSERGRLDVVTAYWREHLNADVEWTEVYAGTFRAWRCHMLTTAR